MSAATSTAITLPPGVTRRATRNAGWPVPHATSSAVWPGAAPDSRAIHSAHDQWLVMHPEFRRDPKVRAVASFLRRAASSLV
jgi:hypothetical protein